MAAKGVDSAGPDALKAATGGGAYEGGMPLIRKLALAALPLLALSACDFFRGSTPEPVDTNAALAAIRALQSAQFDAADANDLAGAVAHFAPDAIFVAPGASPVSGPAINQAFQALLADPAFSLVLVDGSERATIGAHGDLAITGFTAQMSHTGEKAGTVTDRIGNQTVWQLNEAGVWQIVSDVNYIVPTEPAATAATPTATAASERPAPAPRAVPARIPPGKPTGK